MLIIRCPKCGAKKEVQTCHNPNADRLEHDCGRCSYQWITPVVIPDLVLLPTETVHSKKK